MEYILGATINYFLQESESNPFKRPGTIRHHFLYGASSILSRPRGLNVRQVMACRRKDSPEVAKLVYPTHTANTFKSMPVYRALDLTMSLK